MGPSAVSRPIVVGIDGSKHAIRAAIWAVDEAVSRDIPLVLTHVVKPDSHDLDGDYAYGRDVLHKAWVAASAADKLVKLESSVLQGDPVTELVELSASAQMICIGPRGIHDSPKHERGSTAKELAKRATSSVAVIHRRHRRALIHDKWIVVALDEALGSQVLLESAFDEALLRRAPILALTPSARTDRGTDSTDHRDPRARLEECIEEAGDVQVCALPAPDDMTSFLAQCADIGQTGHSQRK